METFNHLYSRNVNSMRRSIIRELLKLTNQPGLISFAGGLPDPATFPVDELRQASESVFSRKAGTALQYGTTEGFDPLKAELVRYEAGNGIKAGKENILITSASQQALDMIAKLFLDPGDYVIAGRPTYLGTLQAIQSYQGEVLGIPFSKDNTGFDMDALGQRYAKALSEGKKIKYIYVIPDFQNPTGICWSVEKRKALLAFAYTHNLPIAEDAPYREIRFMGKALPSIYQLDQEGENRGIVINMKTFSKILAPGVRTGWIIANSDIISRLVVAKQAMDLCSNVFTQVLLAEYLAAGTLQARIDKTSALYKTKRDHMVAMLKKHMPARPDLSWTEPEGGLFLWVRLPDFINTETMFAKAIEKKVAYVIGSAFYADNPEHNAMRLNFSFSSPEEIEVGIQRLGDTIRDEIAAHEAKR